MVECTFSYTPYNATNTVIKTAVTVRASKKADKKAAANENNNEITTHPYSNDPLGLSIDILRINPDTKKFSFSVSQKELQNDFVIMKAIIFPYINLVWLGGILIFFGSFMSMWQRRFKKK